MQKIVSGIPTEPDVKMLMLAFPNVKADDSIGHEEVEAVIQVARGTPRYRTVTEAWRRRVVEERGLYVDSVPGIGFRVLTEEERAGLAVKHGRKGVRQIGRAVRDIGRVQTEKLSEQQQASTLHARRLMEGMAISCRDAMKQIAAPVSPPKQLPRFVPAAAKPKE